MCMIYVFKNFSFSELWLLLQARFTLLIVLALVFHVENVP